MKMNSKLIIILKILFEEETKQIETVGTREI